MSYTIFEGTSEIQRLVVARSISGLRDHSVVCLTETSASGVKFAITDIAAGPLAGTFFGRAGCPTPLTAVAVSKLGG